MVGNFEDYQYSTACGNHAIYKQKSKPNIFNYI